MKTLKKLWIQASLVLISAFPLGQNVSAQTPSRLVFHAGVLVQKKHVTYEQLFSINPDGSGLTQLTSANASSSTPAWSPGQQYIAFGRSGITVMEAKGETYGGRSFVVGVGNEPDWSPDGTMIVFRKTIRYADGYHDDLYIVSVNALAGTAGTPVFFAPNGFRPSWSSAGTKIAFKRYDDAVQNSAIIVRDVATGTELAISAGPGYNDTPSWKPDGTQIAFAYGAPTVPTASRGIYVANADGSNIRQLTFLNNTAGGEAFPTWSPDATELAFRNDISGTRALYKMNLLSGPVTLLRQPGNAPDWAPYLKGDRRVHRTGIASRRLARRPMERCGEYSGEEEYGRAPHSVRAGERSNFDRRVEDCPPYLKNKESTHENLH